MSWLIAEAVPAAAVGGDVLCKISDFGTCAAVSDVDGVPSDGRTEAKYVNSRPYRPFVLFRQDGLVRVHPWYDVWALGCVIFDCIQPPPCRLRSRSGKPMRLMEGIELGGGDVVYKAMWLRRNRRILDHARPCTHSLILAAQPQELKAVRLTAADVFNKLKSIGCVSGGGSPRECTPVVEGPACEAHDGQPPECLSAVAEAAWSRLERPRACSASSAAVQ